MEHKEGNVMSWRLDPKDSSMNSFKILSKVLDFLYGLEEASEIEVKGLILISGTFFGSSIRTSGEKRLPVEGIIRLENNTFYAVCKRYETEYIFEFSMESMSPGQKYIEHLMTFGLLEVKQ